ncbi:MAG: hypothetical protein IJT07_02575 [Oscillospiraceae bacterium]|nr:hypothetical protein [Oscillospiraceae bacterium]
MEIHGALLLETGYFGGQQTAVNQARGTPELIDTLTDDLVRGLPDGTAQPDGALVQTITDGLTAGLANGAEVGYTDSAIVRSLEDVEYSEKKTVGYLLNPDHPVGGPKAKFMRDVLRYTQNDAVEFHKSVASAIVEKIPTKIEQTQYGT